MEQNQKPATQSPGLGESYTKSTPNSSSVDKIVYDSKTRVLSITFKRANATYDYNGVTPEVALAVWKSDSPGNAARNELSAYKGVKR